MVHFRSQDQKSKGLTRRSFLRRVCSAAPAMTLLPLFQSCGGQPDGSNLSAPAGKIRFGMIADAHADLIPDKMKRLDSFMEKVFTSETDFILQLGDFCFPKLENLDFVELWNTYGGSKYHVLGNHDMDVSSKGVIMDYLGMTDAYYSFDQGGVHFVVLDANYLYADGEYKHYDTANFYVDDSLRTFINSEQLEWLRSDLKTNQLPTIIFSHQSLINPLWGVKNRVEVQQILEEANKEAGYQKVIACFNGHDHIDFHRSLNGIHYIELNSMSYQWVGAKYSNKTRYDAALYTAYPNLDKIAPYEEALYTFVEIDLQNGL